ncbi:S8 family peptidase [Desulfuribacillus alkaliarsenatis]|uniref:SLH domain-containing protein n=1 Tax=Desulfuribacillus alkaliarsenatis TaxID=766136 RepID=A0A1E5G1M6_9FIRM|nr:S8 family serine peptidase [Desulfuribacillus alkaliarsenatis]OEF96814.1 hypothetical protein BHF68_07065 [Desulfuribacillus alkaliarsenatis]
MNIYSSRLIIVLILITLIFIDVVPSAATVQPTKNTGKLVEVDLKEKGIIDRYENKSYVTALSYTNLAPLEAVQDRIAIIDTGISWNHTALSDIDAIYWRNVISNNNNVQDNHGHGTQIAGLLASSGRSGAPRGLLPNAKYIILKGLNDRGETEDFVLAQSIRTAVDYGARVIVLSLGISVHSNVLKEAVDYAYQNNVLIIAAAGNYTKQPQYPAAYPTVLSVGSVDSRGIRSAFSPTGYELDVLAQGEQVTVLQLERGTRIAHGTSMAVPIVAALAMETMRRNPSASVDEIINHIITNSKNSLNWNQNIGYGEAEYQLITNSTILQSLLRHNNTTPNRAMNIPRNGIISTRISNENQYRWYKVAAGFEGDITVTYRNRVNSYIKLDVFDENLRLISSRWLTADNQRTTFRVSAEGTYIRISSDASNTPTTASFIFDYRISADVWEPNNTINQAKPLSLRSSIESTLHSNNDQDWFFVDVVEAGDLRIEIKNVPEHMDPMLMVRYGGFTTTVDSHAAGIGEVYTMSGLIGRYTFGVRDYNWNIVNYPYTIEVSFQPSSVRYTDISQHWARNDIQRLYRLNVLQEAFNENRFHPNRYITRAEYASLIVKSLRLTIPPSNTRSYRDVSSNHWASQAIATAKHYGLIQGYPDNTFRPDMPITRAEIAMLTHNAYGRNLLVANTNSFSDVPNNYWANGQISSLARNNILLGYPDGSFRPNFYTTRAEAVAIVSRLTSN